MTLSTERLNESETTAWRTYMEMQEVLRGHLEQQFHAESGLSSAEYTVLTALSEAPDGRMRALNLGRRLQWEKSRLHHQLTRMCTRGLVERLSGDGCTSLAAITPEGRAARDAALPAYTREVRRLVFDRLSEHQVQQLADISCAVLDGNGRSFVRATAVPTPTDTQR